MGRHGYVDYLAWLIHEAVHFGRRLVAEHGARPGAEHRRP